LSICSFAFITTVRDRQLKLSALYFYLINFKFAEKHQFTPEIALGYDDLDGEAMANTGVDLKLNYSYFGDPVTLVLNGSIGQADYERATRSSARPATTTATACPPLSITRTPGVGSSLAASRCSSL
jgi:hypothetical protein